MFAVRALAMMASGMLVLWLAAGRVAGEAPREHELRVDAEVQVAVGARAAASLSLTPAAGRQIHRQAPLSVKMSASDKGVRLPKPRLGLADAADARAEAPRFDLWVEGVAAGRYEVWVDVAFWLCGGRTCRPVAERARVLVNVVAAGAG